jgi:hypothetical protein
MWRYALLLFIMLSGWVLGWLITFPDWTVRDAWLSGYVTGTLATVGAFVVHRAILRR